MRRAVEIGVFRCLKLPRLLRGKSVSLRRLAIPDAFFLENAIVGQRDMALYKRWWRGLRLWWWMKGRYACVYVVRKGVRKVGLIGLYDMTLRPRPRAALSLVIPAEETRHKGYGKEACDLLLGRIAKNHGLDEIEVAVAQDDQEARSFWEGLGFMPVMGMANPTVLRMSLTNQ